MSVSVHANAAQVATDPGDYNPLPAGVDLGLLYYQHTTPIAKTFSLDVVGEYSIRLVTSMISVQKHSLLPTSIGYNPSETVYALSSYIADQIITQNFSRSNT